MQRLQNRTWGSVCTFARYAMRQNGFSLDFCRVCNEDFDNQIVIPQWGKWYLRFWQTIPRWVKPCLRFGWDFTSVGYGVPENRFGLYPSGNFMPWIGGHFHPLGISCLRISLDFTPVGISCPEISSDFTPGGMACPRFGLQFCMGGKIVPWIQFTFLQGENVITSYVFFLLMLKTINFIKF